MYLYVMWFRGACKREKNDLKKNCTILIILRVLCVEEPSRVRVIDVCKRFTSNLNYILLLSNNTANFFSTRKLNEV